MGTVEVADQLKGVDFLKRQPFVAPDKITTFGWSYGRYMTLKLLDKTRGVFAAGVAVAPVPDWDDRQSGVSARGGAVRLVLRCRGAFKKDIARSQHNKPKT